MVQVIIEKHKNEMLQTESSNQKHLRGKFYE